LTASGPVPPAQPHLLLSRPVGWISAPWCLGSSALAPRLLLLYPPAPLGIFGPLLRSPQRWHRVASRPLGTGRPFPQRL